MACFIILFADHILLSAATHSISLMPFLAFVLLVFADGADSGSFSGVRSIYICIAASWNDVLYIELVDVAIAGAEIIC